MEAAIQTLVKVYLKSSKGKENLGKKDFQNLVKTQLGNILSDADSKDAINDMAQGLDANHDGKVGFPEYMKLIGYLATSLSEQRAMAKEEPAQNATGQVANCTPDKEEKTEANAEVKPEAKADGTGGPAVGPSVGFNVQVPKVEVPKVDVPTVEVPKVVGPTVEVPKVEVPTVEVPKVEVPTVEVKGELPTVEVKGELPTVEVPKVEVPTVDVPKVEVPKVEVPKLDVEVKADGGVLKEAAEMITTTTTTVVTEGSNKVTEVIEEVKEMVKVETVKAEEEPAVEKTEETTS